MMPSLEALVYITANTFTFLLELLLLSIKYFAILSPKLTMEVFGILTCQDAELLVTLSQFQMLHAHAIHTRNIA